ncbi:MAG TPA: tetratricopeptide repeat protein, partial [Tepidisphaeraceae bacterium]|nr:tetratricopeptide repeat protein [Tepidisphaeraceae bacterium]
LIFFFFAAALPTSNLIVTIGSIFAERFMYLPLVAFAGIVVVIVFALAQRLIHNQLVGRAVAIVFLSATTVACAYRTYLRNIDWQSDLSLWTSAQQVCPQDFRCYQSLAFALYLQNPTANIDRMISLDEQAIPIVDPLPDYLNSSQLYTHLGLFYSIKGDLLGEKTSAGVEMYKKSVAVLERAIEIDRAFNEVNRAKAIRRGDKPLEIADMGRPEIYIFLAADYVKLGDYDKAASRLTYHKHLDPQDWQTDLKIGYLRLAQGQYDDAAVAIIESITLDPTHPEAWQTLEQIYSHFGPQGSDAVVHQNGKLQLNLQNPLLRDHLTKACRDLIRYMLSAKMPALAEQLREFAAQRYDIPRPLLDEIFNQPPLTITPYEIISPQVSPTTQ